MRGREGVSVCAIDTRGRGEERSGDYLPAAQSTITNYDINVIERNRAQFLPYLSERNVECIDRFSSAILLKVTFQLCTCIGEALLKVET